MATSRADTTKYYSSIQEDKIARFLGWSTVSGSGARPNRPGDVQSSEDGFLVECKTHMKRHACEFKKATWDKIKMEATSMFREPLYITDSGTQWIKDTWAMCQSSIVAGHDNVLVKMLPSKLISAKQNISFESYNLKATNEEMKDFDFCVWEYSFDEHNDVVIMDVVTFKSIVIDKL